MGYYTRHRLKLSTPTGAPLTSDQILAAHRFLNENVNARYALDLSTGPTEIACADSCKWYDHDEDMRAISNACPGVLFALSGDGEESGDIWTSYYLDGKGHTEKAQIIVAPFDATKLR